LLVELGNPFRSEAKVCPVKNIGNAVQQKDANKHLRSFEARSGELRILDQYPVFIMLNNQHETFSGEDRARLGMREYSSLMMIERQPQIGEEASP
jgi:hypothetical protein